MMRAETAKERDEKSEAALKQLLTCARAECDGCQLVPNPEKWSECTQVIETCEEILRESLGLPEEEEGEADGTKTE